MTEKFLPQDTDTEESILSSILLDASAISKTADKLPVDAFYLSAHQQIYKAALELYYQDKLTDITTVGSWLSDHKLLRNIGGRNKLAQLANNKVSADNIDSYTELVLEKYKRRQLIEAGSKIVELGFDTTIDLEKVIDLSEEKIFKITENKVDKFSPKAISNSLSLIVKQLGQEVTPALSTGLIDLDKLMGGLLNEDLIVIAARASMGKTWLGCHFANHVALTYNLPVVFFSSETSKEQLTKRFLAMHAKINSHRLIHNKIYKSEVAELRKALEVLYSLPIIIDDTPASLQNPIRMRSALRRIKFERGNLGLIVMDYIQKLGDRAASNRAQAIGKFSGAFKDLAKEFSCPFVALAQINRGVENQTDKRPAIADIKDSGDIEQDMDVGLLLYRDEYYDSKTPDKGVMEINVAKNRNGATGVCKVLFDGSIGEIRNITV
ncbi:replicative DNA helicase [Nostoc edaphicum CCNP1411]|uniref:Replicative DNA helicase n=1 Tax=Nostoc edaphicum CCNP1411 TaxID=1472755 RepID=A0A7D7QWG6_9NOSO|nr:replicative DNA helicase [Nostoc edaphicum]QMS91343.1 replicative DNA helicase [Nostoc edaphicum CCNP1411]